MKWMSAGAGLVGLVLVGVMGMVGCDPEIVSTRYQPDAHPATPPLEEPGEQDGAIGDPVPTVWDGSDHDGSGSALLSFTGNLSNRRFRLMRMGPSGRGGVVTYQFSFDLDGESWLLEMSPHRYGFLWTCRGEQAFELEIWHRAEDWVLISERTGNGEGLIIEFRERWDGTVSQHYTYYSADRSPVVLYTPEDFDAFLATSELNLHNSVAQEIAFEVLFNPSFQTYMASHTGSGTATQDRKVPACFAALRKALSAGTMAKCAFGGPANGLCDLGIALTSACLVTEAIWTMLPDPPEPPEEGEGEDPPPPEGRLASGPGVHPYNPLERAMRGVPLGEWR